MLHMAPSLSTAEKVLRLSKMPRPCQAGLLFFFGNGEVISCGKNGVEWGSLSWAFVRALEKFKVLSAKMRNDVQNVLTPLAASSLPTNRIVNNHGFLWDISMKGKLFISYFLDEHPPIFGMPNFDPRSIGSSSKAEQLFLAAFATVPWR